MAYFFVAVASVTHTDLLLNRPVTLPILQIDVDLQSFFFVAPILFVLIHFGVLLHHALLEAKAASLNELLATGEKGNARTHRLRMEVSSYFYSQIVAGPNESRVLTGLLRAMRFLTLVFLPLGLLLYFQFSFLPVHNAEMTMLHRSFIAIDACLVLFVKNGSPINWLSSRSILRRIRQWRGLGFSKIAAIALALLLSIGIGTLPARDNDDPERSIDLDRFMTTLWPTRVPFDFSKPHCEVWRGNRCAFWLTAALLELPVDHVSGRAGLFARNLIVTDKRRAASGTDFSYSLRGRDLRFATFDRSELRLADFTAADLSGASFKGADLRDASFDCAVTGKKLVTYVDPNTGESRTDSEDDRVCTNLQSADLSEAKLSSGAINSARLLDTKFVRTNLEGFDLSNLVLVGANFSDAVLRGTRLIRSVLTGADFSHAKAEGAYFVSSTLQAADFFGAQLDFADFREADLSGASLAAASLFGTDLRGSLLFGANFPRARIWRTAPTKDVGFTLADLNDLRLGPPRDDEVERLAPLKESLAQVGQIGARESYSYLSEGLRERIGKFFDGDSHQEWTHDPDHAAWRRIASDSSTMPSRDREIGGYLAGIACRNDRALDTLLRARLGIYLYSYSYDYFGDYYYDRTIPPGVTEDDLEKLRVFGRWVDSEYWTRPGYKERPIMSEAFYSMLNQSECAAAKIIGPAAMKLIRQRLDQAGDRDAATQEKGR